MPISFVSPNVTGEATEQDSYRCECGRRAKLSRLAMHDRGLRTGVQSKKKSREMQSKKQHSSPHRYKKGSKPARRSSSTVLRTKVYATRESHKKILPDNELPPFQDHVIARHSSSESHCDPTRMRIIPASTHNSRICMAPAYSALIHACKLETGSAKV